MQIRLKFYQIHTKTDVVIDRKAQLIYLIMTQKFVNHSINV